MANFATAPDGVRLATYEWGDPAGPELLLIHGIAQCHLCWRPQFESELTRSFRIVAFDMRGHGASDKPDDPRAYQGQETWARDIAAVIEAKRLRRPVLAGWSMGGRVTRQYLMRIGDGRLAGVNFVASQVVEEARFRGPDRPRPVDPGSTLAERIDEAIRFVDGCFAVKPAEPDFRIMVAYNMLVPPRVRQAIAGWSTDAAETVERLQRVRVPVLVSHGRRDSVVLPAAAETAAATIPGARLSWYEQSGHSPFAEEPQRFNRELAQFAVGCR